MQGDCRTAYVPHLHANRCITNAMAINYPGIKAGGGGGNTRSYFSPIWPILGVNYTIHSARVVMYHIFKPIGAVVRPGKIDSPKVAGHFRDGAKNHRDLRFRIFVVECGSCFHTTWGTGGGQ